VLCFALSPSPPRDADTNRDDNDGDDLQSEDDLYARKLKTLSTMNFFSISGGDLNGALNAGRAPSNSISGPNAAAAAAAARASSPAASTTAAATPAPAAGAASAGSTSGKEPVVDYDRLKVNPVPEGVDAKNKELHLSDAQFVQFLKMSRDQWAALPQWKKLRIKKEVGLF
jgi:hypothetical protein